MRKFFKGVFFSVAIITMPLSAIAGTLLEDFNFSTKKSGTISYDNSILSGGGIRISSYTGPEISSPTNSLILQFNFQADADQDWVVDDDSLIKNLSGKGDLYIKDSSDNSILHGYLSSVLISADPDEIGITFGSLSSSAPMFTSVLKTKDFGDITYGKTAMTFSFVSNGEIDIDTSTFNGRALAGGTVHGTNPVPVPAAAWIFLTGIAGLAGLRRKNKK